jgi:hypothetical protein
MRYGTRLSSQALGRFTPLAWTSTISLGRSLRNRTASMTCLPRTFTGESYSSSSQWSSGTRSPRSASVGKRDIAIKVGQSTPALLPRPQDSSAHIGVVHRQPVQGEGLTALLRVPFI